MQTTLEVTVTAAHTNIPLRDTGHDSPIIAHELSLPVDTKRRPSRLSLTLAIPKAFWICMKIDRGRLIQQWVIIPVVILAMLVYVWAVNLLVGMYAYPVVMILLIDCSPAAKLPFTFPASVSRHMPRRP